MSEATAMVENTVYRQLLEAIRLLREASRSETISDYALSRVLAAIKILEDQSLVRMERQHELLKIARASQRGSDQI